MKFYLMTFKGQRRRIVDMTSEETRQFTDAEWAEYRSLARCRLSTEFAKKGDPRTWKDPLSQGQEALTSMIGHYSEWLHGDWNETRGVTPPPFHLTEAP